jgi:hypothetical protein
VSSTEQNKRRSSPEILKKNMSMEQRRRQFCECGRQRRECRDRGVEIGDGEVGSRRLQLSDTLFCCLKMPLVMDESCVHLQYILHLIHANIFIVNYFLWCMQLHTIFSTCNWKVYKKIMREDEGRFTLWPSISTNQIARNQEFGLSTLHIMAKVQRP